MSFFLWLSGRSDGLERMKRENEKLMNKLIECEKKLASAEGDNAALKGEIKLLRKEIGILTTELALAKWCSQQWEQFQHQSIEELQQFQKKSEQGQKQNAEGIEILKETVDICVGEINELRSTVTRQQDEAKSSNEEIQRLQSILTEHRGKIAAIEAIMERNTELGRQVEQLQHELEQAADAQEQVQMQLFRQMRINQMLLRALQYVRNQQLLMEERMELRMDERMNHMMAQIEELRLDKQNE